MLMSLFKNHNYLLMECVCLLDTAQLLKPWTHPYFLFHINFGLVLAFNYNLALPR